jgi:glutamate N-acetyltransferase/amino-acid N-acetyltransferase
MQIFTKIRGIRRFATIPSGGLIPENGTYPLAFRASGVSAGVKKKSGAKDMALVASEIPCTASAVFTTNAFQAAPVVLDKEIIAKSGDNVFGVLTNSGCANAWYGHSRS